ncbi:hypothetical protein DID78_04285 [Candidatus Marinamargulisbacteria bacterium SCGC AG-343-D04]|nr:hypothetical protein DID78_04285 [Candidatus Marinamargulisbacteria bacterium SCGC AG-343-D04]
MNLLKWIKILKNIKTPDTKKGNASFLLILSLLWGFTLTTYADVYFHDFPDDGTRELAYSAESYQEHYAKSLDYNMHVSTPGYIRKSITNKRLYDHADGKHLVVGSYSYKWIEGNPYETGDPLHFCINGSNKAFFTIQLNDGIVAYTRDGRFRISHTNHLVTLSGNFPVLGEEGPIIVPYRGDYTITRHGNFYIDEVLIDKFKITIFKNFDDMNRHLDNANATFFTLNEPIDTLSGDKHYNILQGFISHSNAFRSNDSWYYRSSQTAGIRSLYMLIDGRRTLFNALN